MKTKTPTFDIVETIITLLALAGFSYTLYSFLSFAWHELSWVQITITIFCWILLWEVIGFSFIFTYRFCTGQLVILQKIQHFLSKPSR